VTLYAIQTYGLNLMEEFIDDMHSTTHVARTVGRLERRFSEAFEDTQNRVHVITGSLRLSGKSQTNFDGEVWTGEIEYGGLTQGPINPVQYAVYEMARGGDHDFFAGLPTHEELLEEAVGDHFERRRP
jgi:hypothetical protein